MQTFSTDASLGHLGLSEGDHWVRMHVEKSSISVEVAGSVSHLERDQARQAVGFVEKWGGSARRLVSGDDPWLAHINEKHLR